MSDHFRTIAARTEARIKIERSEFLGVAIPIESEEQFFAELAAVEKRYFDATHHCWAFRLFGGSREIPLPRAGEGGQRPGEGVGSDPHPPSGHLLPRAGEGRRESRSRSSDAGEPSGTAGKPILNAIESAEYHDAGVIVVRWYGGIKLGTGGLARAYRDSAAEVLRAAQPVDRYLYERITVAAPFDSLGVVYRLVEPPAVVLAEERFGEENEFVFEVRRSRADAFRKLLADRRLILR